MLWNVSPILLSDRRGQDQFDALLKKAGIRRDNNLDYIAGVYDSDYKLVACGACFGNTLRCLAVDNELQGEGLMATMVTHLFDYQMEQGNSHLFLYTKSDNIDIFSSLGFYEIERAGNDAVLMENRKKGFQDYLNKISAEKKSGKTAMLVMNCNPFTLGHRYLIETASKENDNLFLFVVSEDMSLFSFADRFKLVKEGCAGLTNISFHSTGSYMISSATFPSYFLKDDVSAIEVQVKLDLAIFTRIANAAGATARYVGDEPFSVVTNIYNKTMIEKLPLAGIKCVVLPRCEKDGKAVSASAVRKLIQAGDMEGVKQLVPETTYRYFFTENGKKVIEKIKAAKDVVHY